MEEARYRILEAKLLGQLDELRKVYAKLERKREGFESNEDRLESLAYQLHNLYCAFEELMELVADAFENQIEEAGAWHAGLLRRMRIDIPGVRPPLFSDRAYELLDDLRQFRHVFRHAYGRELDPEKVRLVLNRTLGLQTLYEVELQTFLGRLRPPPGADLEVPDQNHDRQGIDDQADGGL